MEHQETSYPENLNDLNDLKDPNNFFEPYHYYEYIKGKLETQEQSKLDNELSVLINAFKTCKRTGQRRLCDIIIFNIKCIIHERALLSLGITEYIDKESIQKFVESVKPKNSIKIIELSRYPRTIPQKEAKLIQIIKDKHIFDDICIIFTDFTKNDYKTEEEKELVKRNRDPICFGMFRDTGIDKNYKRLYKICDWVDDYCDLTFDKMVNQMSKMNIDCKNGTIEPFIDMDTIDEINKELNKFGLDNLDKSKKYNLPIKQNLSVFQKIQCFLKKLFK